LSFISFSNTWISKVLDASFMKKINWLIIYMIVYKHRCMMCKEALGPIFLSR
jgi:hypothetical protein